MRIFISHREIDVELAKALIDVLQVGLPIESDQILCTSVAGHKLRFGKSIEKQIKDEIQNKPVLFALLTRSALASSWVTFELGAAWGMDVLTIPILGKGVEYHELPAALSSYPCISAEQSASDVRASMNQALEQARQHGNIVKKPNTAKLSASVDTLIDLLAKSESSGARNASATTEAFVPAGYELLKTPVGSAIFRSTTAPIHSLCPACWTDKGKKNILNEDGAHPVVGICPVCKTVYSFREDDPMSYGGRRDTYEDY